MTDLDRHQPAVVLLDRTQRLLAELDQLADLLDTCRVGLRARIAAIEHTIRHQDR